MTLITFSPITAGTIEGIAMPIDPTFFPKLLHVPLQCHAERWAKDFKNRINRICLHQCIDPSHFKCKYVRYVIVFEHLLGEGDPEYKELYDDYYSIDRITHDELLDERFVDVYQNVPKFTFRDEWDFILKEGDQDLSGIISQRFLWQLFPDEAVGQSLIPVKTGLKSEAGDSGKVDGFIENLRIFRESDVEIGIQEPGKPAISYNFSLFGIRSPKSQAWILMQKMLQSPHHTFDISNIRRAKPETNRKMLTGQINRAFVTVFRTLFPQVGIPEGYKVYKQREVGCYQLKFKITGVNAVENSRYEGYSKNKLLDEMRKLNKDFEGAENNDQKERILENLTDAFLVAREKEYITENEVENYYPIDKSETPTIDTSRINPHQLLYAEREKE